MPRKKLVKIRNIVELHKDVIDGLLDMLDDVKKLEVSDNRQAVNRLTRKLRDMKHVKTGAFFILYHEARAIKAAIKRKSLLNK